MIKNHAIAVLQELKVLIMLTLRVPRALPFSLTDDRYFISVEKITKPLTIPPSLPLS